jgi:hypothetical protein
VKSLESFLVENGLVDPAALDALVDACENKLGPRNGAKIVESWRVRGPIRPREPPKARRLRLACARLPD